MPMTVTASEARAQFPAIAKAVHENNMEVTVVKGSKPYVKIVPIEKHEAIDAQAAYLAADEEFEQEYHDLFEALAR
ncbi:prevent-host-death protein [Gordonibacter sp. 28C]|uniref:type II toxin-antitoxin system Phd/YefM family antitoxin n=1 Tax=Gordonibacter sp. 28C TaxID=2078569 RepID=UPI000DF7B2FA|nr:type II toxin-antitoxin system prevent-host-death family antitoxin [Gordonibacter sp. 28C]RDB61370.1 prevent-host-death protein [Gordonibacter sp. 28C]